MIEKVGIFYFITFLTHLSSLSFNTQIGDIKKRNLVLIDPDPDDPYGIVTQVEGYLENNFGNFIQGKALYSPTFAKELFDNYDLTNDEINEIKENEFNINGLERDFEDICGVLCVSDTGLKTREIFSKTYFKSNVGEGGIDYKEARRDKYLQMEALKMNNVRTMRQILTDDEDEALQFYNHVGANNVDGEEGIVVVKPARGSASVAVSKCASRSVLLDKFRSTLGVPGYANGTVSDAILVQEFLKGEEFAIDTVSRRGEHKCVANWRYEKKPLNGGDFVYVGTILMEDKEIAYTIPNDNSSNNINSNIEKRSFSLVDVLNDYAISVLNALEITEGPCHLEVMMTETGPVLIEANCGRWHVDDFIVLSNLCIGYNAVNVALDACLSNLIDILDVEKEPELFQCICEAKKRWDAIPIQPQLPYKCHGRILNLWSPTSGILLKTPVRPEVSSLLRWQPRYSEVGDEVIKTIDLATDAGWCVLAHHNYEQVVKDSNEICRLQENLFITKIVE